MTVNKHRNRCFLDVEIDGKSIGRIVLELFSDVCPITSENFRALCTGEKGKCKLGNALHYRGVPFHRIVKGFMVQGGDFVAGNGTGGESIYGGSFKDENFDYTHEEPFMLSMANKGKDSNGSQFFITTRPAPHLDGKNTVFGRVISGQDVVLEIENIPTDQSCRPVRSVNVSNCGELLRKKRKKSVSESGSGSEEGEMKSKKRKKKHVKHSKKHKREKEKKDMVEPPHRNEVDFGVALDPEEIPAVPVNNFLLRRASPMRDNRSEREFNRYRPSKSKSGRNLKGRGLMRYRTPSRSRSRSGSETPPHWKQAQSGIRRISEISFLKEEVTPSPEKSPTPDEEEVPLEIIPRINVLNRIGRGISPTGSGGLRSMVTVTSNFSQKTEDKPYDHFEQRKSYRRGRRSQSQERRHSGPGVHSQRWRDRSRENRRPLEKEARNPTSRRRDKSSRAADRETDILRLTSNSSKINKDKEDKKHRSYSNKSEEFSVKDKRETKEKSFKAKSSILKSMSDELKKLNRIKRSPEKKKVSKDKIEIDSLKNDLMEKVPDDPKENASVPLVDIANVASDDYPSKSDEVESSVISTHSLSMYIENVAEPQDVPNSSVKIKEKRRWDVKESLQKDINLCEIPPCNIPMPDLIPLPNEVSLIVAESRVPDIYASKVEDKVPFSEDQIDTFLTKNHPKDNTNIVESSEQDLDIITSITSIEKSSSPKPVEFRKEKSRSPLRTRSRSRSVPVESSSPSPKRNIPRPRSKSNTPDNKLPQQKQRSKSPIKRKLSRTPERKSRRSRSASPRSRSNRGRSHSNRRSTSRRRYDRARRSPSPRPAYYGHRRGSPDRRGRYQRRTPAFRGRGQRSRSPVRQRRRSRSSSSDSTSSNSSSSSGSKRVSKKGSQNKRRQSSSSSSSSGSASP